MKQHRRLFQEKANEGFFMKRRSMRQGANLRIFPTLVLLLLFIAQAYAENTDPVQMAEDDKVEIVVSYTREDSPKEKAAANLAVVSREEIEKIPATNAAEVIQYIPGVYVEFNGGLGSQATASIQGSDFRQVAVYRDNVPLNMLANPMTDLSYIPVESIERIEVYKGAASSAWGSALGGVINIVTKEPDLTKPFTGNVQNSYGEFDTFRNNGTVSGTVDRFGYLLSLTHDQSDGVVDHADFRQDAVYAKFNYAVGETGRINFISSYDEGRNENPSALLTGFLNYWEEFHRSRAYQRLLYETTLWDGISYTIEGRHQQFDLVDDYVQVDSKTRGFDYDEELWGISTRLNHEIPNRNHLVLGFDGDWGGYDFSSYASDFDSGNWAVYANDTVDLGPFSLIGGLRYDNNLDFGSEVSPLGGVVCRLPWKDGLIRAQVARGFSAPPGAWLNDPVYGNKDLKAETGVNYQVGGELRPLKFLKLEVNLFQADIDDLINFDLARMKWSNIDEVTRRGIEGRVSANFTSGPLSGLALSFGGSYVDVRDAKTDEVIPDIPDVLLDTSASYTYKWLTQSLIGRYVDNNSSFPETQDKVFVFDYLARVKLPSPPCTRINPSLFAAVHNIGDTNYLYRTVFPQPGRWVEGGVRLEF
jgi:vitamin B12 transporter